MADVNYDTFDELSIRNAAPVTEIPGADDAMELADEEEIRRRHSEQRSEFEFPSVVFNTFDQVLKVAGSFGAYQLWFALVLQLCIVLLCGNYVFMPYATYEPDVVCHYGNDSSILLNKRNNTFFCHLFENELCERVDWKAPFHTIIEQWNLICSLDHVPQMINSIQMSGTVIAVLATGALSDLFGRRAVFYVSFLLFMGSTFAGTMVDSWQLFAVCRFAVGGLLSASLTLVFIWGMELTDQKHNVIMNLAGLWQFAYMITAVIAYITGGWRPYLWTINIIGLPLVFIYPLFVESPRWLIQKGYLDKAANHLNRIGSHNRLHQVRISADNLKGIANHKKPGQTIWNELTSVVSDKTLLFYVMLISVIVFATSSGVNAYIFQVSQQKGDPFIKFFLYGLLRLVIPPTIYLADRHLRWFGRRQMVILPLFFVGACMTVVVATILYEPEAKEGVARHLVTGSLMAAAVISNFLWTGIGQYTVELFPTTVRNTASAALNVVDPLAAAIIPLLIYQEKSWPSLPFVFALVSVVIATGLTLVYLPETKGRPIPETLDDLHRLAKNEWGRRSSRPATWKEVCVCGEDQDLLASDGVHLDVEDDNL